VDRASRVRGIVVTSSGAFRRAPGKRLDPDPATSATVPNAPRIDIEIRQARLFSYGLPDDVVLG
jgi:hypothetical protein